MENYILHDNENARIETLNLIIEMSHQEASIARAERRLILERGRKRMKAANA